METMLGISLYSYPYLYPKRFIFLIVAYVYSSTKLEKRAEQFLPGSKGWEGEGGGRGQRGEMIQTMYVHKNK
jgi:hypothetical protein